MVFAAVPLPPSPLAPTLWFMPAWIKLGDGRKGGSICLLMGHGNAAQVQDESQDALRFCCCALCLPALALALDRLFAVRSLLRSFARMALHTGYVDDRGGR